MPRCIEIRGKKVPVLHVHEAGHALAALVTRTAWGCTKPIERIDIGVSSAAPTGTFGGAEYSVLATTFTPSFPPEMDEIAFAGAIPDGHYDKADLHKRIVELSRAAGCDIERWAGDSILFAVCGAVAEAVICRRDPAQILTSGECGDDMWWARFAYCCLKELPFDGDTAPEGFFDALAVQIVRASALIKRNRKAVSALAANLPRKGSVPGERVVEILSASLAPEDR